jgi:hypothetical protein
MEIANKTVLATGPIAELEGRWTRTCSAGRPRVERVVQGIPKALLQGELP